MLTGVFRIVAAHYAPFGVNGRRRRRRGRIVGYGVVPLVAAIGMTVWLPRPSVEQATLVVAVLGIVAAGLLGLLPVAHGMLGQIDTSRRYVPGERPLADAVLNRLRVLRDLHASIAYAVLLLVAGVLSSAGLALLGAFATPPGAWAVRAVAGVATSIVYFAVSSTVLTFVDVATGTFDATESHAGELGRRVERNVGRTGSDARDDAGDASP